MKRKMFPTKLYKVFIFTTFVVITLQCLFQPYAMCTHTITIEQDTSFDFCYIRQVNCSDYYHKKYSVNGSVELDRVYYRKTTNEDYIVINGKYNVNEGTENDPLLIHNMAISIHEYCATSFDVLMKRDSSFYETYETCNFPPMNNANLDADTAYVTEGSDWILYTSVPVKSAFSYPISISLDRIFYKAVILYAGCEIILFAVLFAISKRKYRNDSELIRLIRKIRENYSDACKEKGEQQFLHYRMIADNIDLFFPVVYFVSVMMIVNTALESKTSDFNSAILFALAGYDLCLAVKIIYRLLFITENRKNSPEEEFCRISSFSLPEYYNLDKWIEFNTFLRLSGLLYGTGHFQDAETLLIKSWEVIQPKGAIQHMLYLVLLCNIKLAMDEREAVIENLNKLEYLMMRYEIEGKRETKLYKKIGGYYRMLREEVEAKK